MRISAFKTQLLAVRHHVMAAAFWGALLVFFGLPSVQAQACAGYEREMEAYFQEYAPGAMVDMQFVENLKSRCPNPTAKMTLMYNYLKATDALDAYRAGHVQAYKDAEFYYGKIRENFDQLDMLQIKDPEFTKLFVDRAFKLEQDIQYYANYNPDPAGSGQAIGQYQPGTATRGLNAGMPSSAPSADPWQKKGGATPSAASSRVSTRGLQPSPSASSKSFSMTRSIGEEASQLSSSANGEEYGLVGDLASIKPNEYSQFVGTYYGQKPSGNTRGQQTRSLSGSGTATRSLVPDPGQRNYSSGISLWDAVNVYKNPEKSSTVIAQLNFGDEVIRVSEDQFNYEENTNYTKIRTPEGEAGWVDDYFITQGGKVAAVLEQVPVYSYVNGGSGSLNGQLDAGELVVVDRVNGDWIKVQGHGNESGGWIQGRNLVSAEETEVKIARMMNLAKQQPTPTKRRVELEKITRIPGFEAALLAPVVRDAISRTYFDEGAGTGSSSNMRRQPATNTRSLSSGYAPQSYSYQPSSQNMNLPANSNYPRTNMQGTATRGLNAPTSSPTSPSGLRRPTGVHLDTPLPRASTDIEIPHRSLEVRGAATTLSNVENEIREALLNGGYTEVARFDIPGGFALVTRPEMIRADDAPAPENIRFAELPEPVETDNFMSYMRRALPDMPGSSRFIVFTVSDQNLTTPNNQPSAVTGERFTDMHRVHAWIYVFRRGQTGSVPSQQFLTSVTTSADVAQRHLMASGVWIPLTQ